MFTKRFVDYLQSHGHTVHVIRFTNEKKLPRFVIPIPFHVAEPRTYILIPSEKTASLIRHYLKKLRPDIVYAYCGLSPFDFLLPSICHSLRIPIAAVWHQDFNYTVNPIQLLCKTLFWAYVPMIESVDLLHVFSRKLKNFYARRGINSRKIITLPNGVNPDIFCPGQSQFAMKHSITTGILFMGRMTIVKNPEVLLQSFLSINPPLGTKLVMMGRGDLESKLKEKYADPRIIFTGLITNEKKKLDIMRSCSVFVQPSMNEGMSLSLLESLSTGLACITSDAGNNKDLMKHAGTIIPIGKIKQDLPKTISAYILDPHGTHEKGIQGRKTILAHHTEDTIYTKLLVSLQKTIRLYHAK